MPKVGLDRTKTGRAKGTPNKATALLKDAILKAAESVGEDMKGKGKLIGYCRFLAKTEPKAYAGLLGRVLPTQITDGDGKSLSIAVVRFDSNDPS